jgi:hypothetical protein
LLCRFECETITINTPFDANTLRWQVGPEYASFLVECEKTAKKYGVTVDSALTPCLAAIGSGIKRLSPQSRLGSEITVGVSPNGSLSRSTHKWNNSLLSDWPSPSEAFQIPVQRSLNCLGCPSLYLCGGPNEEFRLATGEDIDKNKCQFYLKVPELIASNLKLFEDLD